MNPQRRRNTQLVRWMEEQELGAAALARLLNSEIGAVTGKTGRLTEGTIRKWRSGEIRWPRTIQRVVLTRVSDRPAADLGFVHPSAPPEEDAVLRRTFIASSVGIAAAAPLLTPRPAIGTSDVRRLQQRVARVTALDDQHGGDQAMETAALDIAQRALALQQQSATERIRSRLYSVAADCFALASWSCIDARAPERAQQHLERAMTLAGLGRDSAAQFRIWGFMSMLSVQWGEHVHALAAAQAGRATGAARRDSLLASLAHARTAEAHARLGDHQAARRSTALAEAALVKAPDIARPDWISYYTRGELNGLTGFVLALAGSHQEAEAHFHQCVSALRPDQHRNRAFYSTRIALEQLAQGDAEEAVHTALAVVTMPTAGIGRTAHLLHQFTTTLNTTAPGSAAARMWADCPRTATA
ncbi:XRE family transcriptional regulator [Streptomyces sp. NPDC001404]|uniref:XRE family transcriptional regulator n=1 Tax=Streptomyces sp. NPDC001404 TaxID=3364571 RepID=UPI00367B5E13